MHDPLFLIALAILIILAVVVIAFVILLIIVLLVLHRTLKQIQRTVGTVEHAALKSLLPLLGFKRMFSNLAGFSDTITAWAKVISGTAKKHKSTHTIEE